MISRGGGPRLLLKRLREIMAETGHAQARLDQITEIIARNMVAEVCSIYLMRAGQVLELFASEGLNPDAVHKTRLRVGEGLVGEIAAKRSPLNLADAQSHPNFVYRPETGEEIYHSFLGVPIMRAGSVIGVLTVQNVTQRHYMEEEIEALQTVAMVLAEMVGTEHLIQWDEVHEGGFERGVPPKLEGIRLADGIAEGVVVLHEPRIAVNHVIAEDPSSERQRLENALTDLRASLDHMIEKLDLGLGGEHRDVLETYRMFADDKGWLERIEEAIESGLSAEAAVQRVQVDMRGRMSEIKNHYIRERLSDLEDLSNRLIRHLSGNNARSRELPENAILVARNLGPADLLEYGDDVAGVILAEGSPNAHVTIVARAIGIPMVGQVRGVVGLAEDGDRIIVDGDEATVFIEPDADVIVSYKHNIAARAEARKFYAALKDQPARTKDGEDISLMMNAGLLVDLQQLDESGAAGIGLFRTEFQFMVAETMPRLAAQTEVYREVLDTAGDKPVVFRTLDIGGDKVVPFMRRSLDQNPALGWRATRLALDRPALLRYQVRALLHAADGRPLNIMFPLVADVSEFRAARAIVDKEMAVLRKAGKPEPRELSVGTMLEVPALIWQLDALMPHADFVSIGSNDLFQFLFACDRSNPQLANKYDLLSPPALSVIRQVVETCTRHGKPVSLCGEMAGRPLEAMALIGLGLREISMPPAMIGPVKVMIRSLDIEKLTPFLDILLDLPDHSLRRRLTDFAHDHEIKI